jgi:hypothetical protein
LRFISPEGWGKLAGGESLPESKEPGRGRKNSDKLPLALAGGQGIKKLPALAELTCWAKARIVYCLPTTSLKAGGNLKEPERIFRVSIFFNSN